MIVKGVVYKIFSRPAGRGTAYSIKLDGNDTYFNAGFKDPGLNQGDSIQFEAGLNAKGYWEANLQSLRKVDPEPVVHTNASTTKVLGKDDYWTRKEQRDLVNDNARNVGASTNTAIAFVELLLKAEAVKIPAKTADREVVIAELVDYYAKKFRGEPAVDGVLPSTGESPVTETAVEAVNDAANWN